jgi:hypothetical protein
MIVARAINLLTSDRRRLRCASDSSSKRWITVLTRMRLRPLKLTDNRRLCVRSTRPLWHRPILSPGFHRLAAWIL